MNSRTVSWLSAMVAVVIILLVAFIAVPDLSNNPDNRETQTVCILDNTTYTMTYHIGTMPICLTNTNSNTVPQSSYSSTNIANRSSSTTTETRYTGLEQVFPNVRKAFDFDHIPHNLTVGNFTIEMVNNGTDYQPPSVNGTTTQYLGFVWAFNVTTPDATTKNVFFLWLPTGPCTPNVNYSCIPKDQWILPNPQNATVMYGNNFANLYVQWNLNSTNLYVSFVQFEQVPVVGPQPSPYVSGQLPNR